MRSKTPSGLAVFVCAALFAHAPLAQAPEIERVSIDSFGNPGNAGSQLPAISADGTVVVFFSNATNLVPDDANGFADIFVHDRTTRETTRVSVASDGTEANLESAIALFSTHSINADGRFVAFQSRASNLVQADTNGSWDIFVHDRDTGTTERISLGVGGIEANNDSFSPSISGDGRFVAFRSDATNLVDGDSNRSADIFVHDRDTGTTERVSVSGNGEPGNGPSTRPVISADGNVIAFLSAAGNLDPNDANGLLDVFVHDRGSGMTELVSVDSDGNPANGASGRIGTLNPAISADGRYVAFESFATNLVPDDTNGVADIFVHDRFTSRTTRVSVASDGTQANGRSADPSLSADGSVVAFQSFGDNLATDDTNGAADVFVRDLLTERTELASVNDMGVQGDRGSLRAALSASAGFVAFDSRARNLLPEGSGDDTDVFVRRRDIGNAPPVADAGQDRVAECTSPTGALVGLDGRGSTDPDGDPLSFAWSGPFGTANGPTPMVRLPLGTDTTTLVVNDGIADSKPDSVMIVVVDARPPALAASLTMVGPGNEPDDDDEGRFRIGFSANDSCDPDPAVTAVLEIDGCPSLSAADGQVIEFELEDDNCEIEWEGGILEIEAPGLTLKVSATDAAGNTAATEVGPTGLMPDNDDDDDD